MAKQYEGNAKNPFSGIGSGSEHPDGDKSIGGFIGRFDSFEDVSIKKGKSGYDKSHPGPESTVNLGETLKP